MNRYLTYCAKSKILDLINKTDSQGLLFKICKNNSIEFNLIGNSEKCPIDAITLSLKPLVITCQSTITRLKTHSVDFDYESQNFIFTRS